MKLDDQLDSEPLAEPDGDLLTEDGLADEFTRRHRDDLRYVHQWGKWLRWDGARWAVEHTLKVYDLARHLVREVAADLDNPRLAAKIKSASTVNAIVSLARAERAHARVSDDFDGNPWLLNTPAGTIDLTTMARRPHARCDGLTKLTPVAPSSAPAVLWQACLKKWTGGDAALMAFLQRLAGYWCTGSVREEKLVLVYGHGGNGKTKFMETVRGALGLDYVTSMAMETLLVTHGDQHPTDLADLRGKRLAIADETEEGRRLAESKVKKLTGGDRVRARHMRQDFFEFAPTHKIAMVGNHRPALRNVDEAMRRRVLLVPFDAVIRPDERDPQLAEKLAQEYPAILGWMLAGTRMWLERGLDPPPRVCAATEEYLASADAVARWREACCLVGPNESMTKAAAFASWKKWAEASGEFVGTDRWLGDRLRQVPKVDEGRIGANRDKAWIGIGLRRGGPNGPRLRLSTYRARA